MENLKLNKTVLSECVITDIMFDGFRKGTRYHNRIVIVSRKAGNTDVAFIVELVPTKFDVINHVVEWCVRLMDADGFQIAVANFDEFDK
jgi:hypothetical protein